MWQIAVVGLVAPGLHEMSTDVQKITVPLALSLSIIFSAITMTWYVTSYISGEFSSIRIFIAEQLATKGELNELAARIRLAELALAQRNGG